MECERCKKGNQQVKNEIELENVANEREKVIEMDELYSYVERKNRIYVITLVSREKRQILAYDKSSKRIQRL